MFCGWVQLKLTDKMLYLETTKACVDTIVKTHVIATREHVSSSWHVAGDSVGSLAWQAQQERELG